MTSLILMYVYYDQNGDIKAITPSIDDSLESKFKSAMFPIAEVEPFLLGKMSPFEYSIKKVKKITSSSLSIVKKKFDNNTTRTLDAYLTKVPDYNLTESIIKIAALTKHNRIELSIDESFKTLKEYGDEEQKDIIETFLLYPSSDLYFTKKNDPYSLYFSVKFSPKELFEKTNISINYNEKVDISNSSVYTKRLLSHYGYLIK